ncbi:MAG TPA: hypothetical protein PKJ27_09670 [Bacteroidales bacterium]|nr:hypothetical protein [Bacteroidales bacterium]
MKQILPLIFAFLIALPAAAQDEKARTGWKFGGALPAISFDSNLGFQYGALVEFYNYGKPSIYPKWDDHI